MTSNGTSQRAANLALILFVGLSLTGCQSFREALGLTKNPPDEFRVLTRAPLLIPPDINLRPPQLAAAPRNELPPAARARIALFPDSATVQPATVLASNAYSDGEIALLGKASALTVDSNIRQVVNAESLPQGRQPQPNRAVAVAAIAAAEPVPVVDAETTVAPAPEPSREAPPAEAVVAADVAPAAAEAAPPMPDPAMPSEAAKENRAPATEVRRRVAAASVAASQTEGLLLLRRALDR